MSTSAKTVMDQALKLPVNDRATLVDTLILSLDKPNPALDAEWRKEAEGRLSAYQSGELAADIDTAVIEPGKPWRNGSNESFNGKFRNECLAMEWFRNRIEAKVVIEGWRHEYNTVRPHSSLGYQTPFEFKKSLTTTQPDGAIFQN